MGVLRRQLEQIEEEFADDEVYEESTEDAIADSKHLFISSANLTEYALTLNMEMGLLIHGEDLARQVKKHIAVLIWMKYKVLGIGNWELVRNERCTSLIRESLY